MPLDSNDIHHGPANIYIGVTNPASPSGWMTHTAGVPTPGTHVGYTEGDAVFRKIDTKFEVNAAQAYSPVDVGLDTELCEVTFTALQRVYDTLRAAFDNTTTVDDVTRMGFRGGGGNRAIRTQSVFISSLRPHQVGKYEISVIYRAYNVNGYEISYRKSGASTYAITLRGLTDTSRTEGDQLYQYSVEK